MRTRSLHERKCKCVTKRPFFATRSKFSENSAKIEHHMVDYNKVFKGISKGSNMSDRVYAKAQVQQKTLIESSPKSSLLQRTCACGQHTLAGGECEECQKKRDGMLQRAAIVSPPVGEAPPIVH